MLELAPCEIATPARVDQWSVAGGVGPDPVVVDDIVRCARAAKLRPVHALPEMRLRAAEVLPPRVLFVAPPVT